MVHTSPTAFLPAKDERRPPNKLNPNTVSRKPSRPLFRDLSEAKRNGNPEMGGAKEPQMLDPQVESRIMAAVNHEEGDRVPIWDYMDNRAVVDHICPGWSNYDDAMAEVYHTLGIDICRGYGRSYAETDDGTTWGTDDHNQTKISGRTAWHTGKPIQTLEELKAFKREPVEEERIRTEWVQSQIAQRERFEPRTMWVPCTGCGFHATYGLMGQEFFSYAIYDDPASVERIMEVEAESNYRFAKAAADFKISPMYLIGDDVAYKQKLMFSPDFLRRTFIKCLKKVAEPLKAAGVKVIFHSDGYVMDIIDDMIDAGIDGLHPIEPLAGMDIGKVKKRWGKNLVLCGNVDCSQTLPLGTVEDVRNEVRDVIRAASPGGGHIIGSSSEIVPSTPVQNVIAFYDACREFGTFPIQF